MNFDFTDDQHQIKRTAREFLEARYKPETIRELGESDLGFTEEQWREMSELGWTGIAIPEDHGGQGLGTVELVVIMEELGYALAPTPFFSNTAAGLILEQRGTDEQKQEFLAPVARGEKRATVAAFDAGTRAEPGSMTMEPRQSNGAAVLEGEKVLVPDAAAADFLVVIGAETAHVVDREAPGVTVTPEASIDSTRKLYSVGLEGVEVPAERSLEELGEHPTWAREIATVALAAEMVGVAQRAMEMAVSYAQEREQFGRPVGAYQAVSHPCAQMLLETEGARAATYYAGWVADNEPENLPLATSVAKAYSSDAAFRVPASSLQVHGGIGFTWEHDLHLWLKRGKADSSFLGDARWHRERVAELVIEQRAAVAA